MHTPYGQANENSIDLISNGKLAVNEISEWRVNCKLPLMSETSKISLDIRMLLESSQHVDSTRRELKSQCTTGTYCKVVGLFDYVVVQLVKELRTIGLFT